MHRDASEPRSQAFRLLQALDRIDCGNENVLNQVPKVDLRPEHANEHALHVFAMAIVERRPSGRLARANRRNDRRIRIEKLETRDAAPAVRLELWLGPAFCALQRK
jgi:hypothetical protein